MAPEILERAISFNRDAFLRIDIYAFALVMWECLTRCTDLPQGPAPYKLPYEKELGTQPTMDDIQYHVVQQGLRIVASIYIYNYSEPSDISTKNIYKPKKTVIST